MDGTLIAILDELYRKQRELVNLSQSFETATRRIAELSARIAELEPEPVPEPTAKKDASGAEPQGA